METAIFAMYFLLKWFDKYCGPVIYSFFVCVNSLINIYAIYVYKTAQLYHYSYNSRYVQELNYTLNMAI